MKLRVHFEGLHQQCPTRASARGGAGAWALASTDSKISLVCLDPRARAGQGRARLLQQQPPASSLQNLYKRLTSHCLPYMEGSDNCSLTTQTVLASI